MTAPDWTRPKSCWDDAKPVEWPAPGPGPQWAQPPLAAALVSLVLQVQVGARLYDSWPFSRTCRRMVERRTTAAEMRAVQGQRETRAVRLLAHWAQFERRRAS